MVTLRVRVFLNVCIVIMQMLRPGLPVPPLGQLSSRRRDQNKIKPVPQHPLSVLEFLVEKGDLQPHSSRRCVWKATVQSLHVCSPKPRALIVCVCWKALVRFGCESRGSVFSSKPFSTLLDRWAHLLSRSLWVIAVFLITRDASVPTADPLYCFSGLVC